MSRSLRMLVFKQWCTLLLPVAVFTMIVINILLHGQTRGKHSTMSHLNVPEGLSYFDRNILNIRGNRSRSTIQFADKLPIANSYRLSLERRASCNLQTPINCFFTNKSLVITFWRQESRQRWLVLNLLLAFPEKYFDHIVMVHDNSSWSDYPAHSKIIWIHVESQLRFWYIKRFVSPHISRVYRYIWVVDDDARFDFNTRMYECVADKYNIPLSAPARGGGVAAHQITQVFSRYASRIGRWTDFVEIGPIFVAKALAWSYLWQYISEKVGLGYGLDIIWCRVLGTHFRLRPVSKICAILDTFVVYHDSTKINTIDIGVAEMPAYHKFYEKYSSQMLVFGAVAPDSTALRLCALGLQSQVSEPT